MKKEIIKSKKSKAQLPPPMDVEFTYTPAGYEEQLAMGVSPEEAIKPGTHKGRRGGFLERHPEFKKEVEAKLLKKKVRVNIMLDSDIIEFFKAQSASPNAAKYQTQINNVLRRFIDGDLRDSAGLVKDRTFIKQLAIEVKSLS